MVSTVELARFCGGGGGGEKREREFRSGGRCKVVSFVWLIGRLDRPVDGCFSCWCTGATNPGGCAVTMVMEKSLLCADVTGKAGGSLNKV